jgi:hypothetical protein
MARRSDLESKPPAFMQGAGWRSLGSWPSAACFEFLPAVHKDTAYSAQLDLSSHGIADKPTTDARTQ